MKGFETSVNSPAAVEKSARVDRWRGLTSCRAGVIVPIAFFPLLREDRISGTVNIQIKMDETVKPLLNGVRAKVLAHLWPNSADSRFSGMEELNASYTKQSSFSGHPPPPFIEMKAMDYINNDIFYRLGIHGKDGTQLNQAVTRAYNSIVNARRLARTWHLPWRAENDETLAQAFWMDANRWDIVPDFDQILMEGLVPLTGSAPVPGVMINAATGQAPFSNTNMRRTGETVARAVNAMAGHTATTMAFQVTGTTAADAWPAIFAELESAGVGVSLANMEMVRKTQAFARLRETYEGNNEENIIDLLMSGIRVPDTQLYEPILLGTDTSIFGMQERHASDYENLDKSYTTGQLNLRIPIQTPAINPGGIVMVTLEVVPESLPELGLDPFLTTGDVDNLPDYVDDTLDPEKVDIVENGRIDAYHTSPGGVFGYEGLNNKWNRDFARIGGKFSDGVTPSTSEERYRIWQVRVADPDLTEDFYLCPTPFPHDVFADTTADPFEVTTLATMTIIGNTVLGPRLSEDKGAFENTQKGVDESRVEQQAALLAEQDAKARAKPAAVSGEVKEGEADGTV